jgi:hypothetical protein
MEVERIRMWLARTVWGEVAQGIVSALGLFGLSVAVLVVLLGLVWAGWMVLLDALVHHGLGWNVGTRSLAALLAGLSVVGLLFWGNWRAARRHAQAARKEVGSRTEGSEGVEVARRGETVEALVAYPGAGTAALLDVMYTGPRLWLIGWSHLSRAWRLRRLDVEGCARVLGVMAKRRSRCQLQHLLREPGIREPLRRLAELWDAGGVLFFQNPPHGFALRERWRHGLMVAGWEGTEEAEQPSVVAGRVSEQVLGVGPDATLDEVQRAYERQARELTVDRGGRMVPELDRAVVDQMRVIRGADEEFMRRHGAGGSKGAGLGSVERVWEGQRGGVERDGGGEN